MLWQILDMIHGIALNLFNVAVIIYVVAAILGVLFRNSKHILYIGSVLMFIASLIIFVDAVSLGAGAVQGGRFTRIEGVLLLRYPVLVDPLSIVLLLVISLVAMATAIYTPKYMEYYEELDRRGLFIALMTTFVASMILIVLSNDLLWFLFMWEVMTFTSYLLIVWEYTERYVLKAGWKYFVSMHFLSTVPLILAVIITMVICGTSSMTTVRTRLWFLDPNLLATLYTLYLLGFASKAGVVPFHFWLPDAHPAAPSNVSALLSGVMIKVAVYGVLRFCCYILPLNTVVGYIVATLGALSLTVGTLYALKQTDAKRLLAYHSVGQMGYIWLGLGAGMVLLASNNPLGVVGIAAGLYHLVNHAVFKGLLFLSAGSILYKTRIRNLNLLGGLSRIMPYTSMLTLIAALSIAGVPPFNGFLSKWLIYESTFSSMDGLLVFYGVLALFISAATLASFIKFYTTAFTGELKVDKLTKGEVPSSMLAGMIILAVFCILWGVLPVTIVPLLQKTPLMLTETISAGRVMAVSPLWISITTSSFSPILLLLFLGLASLPALLSIKLKKPSVPTWDTGVGLTTDKKYYKLIAAHYYRDYEEAIHALYHFGSVAGSSLYNALLFVTKILITVNQCLSDAVASASSKMVSKISSWASRAKEVYLDELIFSPIVSVLRELSKFLGWTVLRTDLNTYLVYSALYVIVLSIVAMLFIARMMLP